MDSKCPIFFLGQIAQDVLIPRHVNHYRLNFRHLLDVCTILLWECQLLQHSSLVFSLRNHIVWIIAYCLWCPWGVRTRNSVLLKVCKQNLFFCKKKNHSVPLAALYEFTNCICTSCETILCSRYSIVNSPFPCRTCKKTDK